MFKKFPHDFLKTYFGKLPETQLTKVQMDFWGNRTGRKETAIIGEMDKIREMGPRPRSRLGP